MIDDERKTTTDSHWETVEHGWRAVVLDVPNTTKMTAFVKYVGAPYWRIWAGQMFDTLEAAQKWCLEEISTQLHKQEIDAPEKPWHAEPPPWQWLWDTLYEKMGEEETMRIRNGFAEQMRQHGPTH